MQLQDGKLYETKHGKRYRVSMDGDGMFACRSFGGRWDIHGVAYSRVWMNHRYKKPHLIREVDESRWIPLSKGVKSTIANARCMQDKHLQIRVSREEAKAIGQEGHNKAILASVTAPTKSGEVRFVDDFGYSCGFTWKYVDEGSFLEITTSQGDILKVGI